MVTYGSSSVRVLGSTMHFREAGGGAPVLLLHGNPTSSFLWRHVMARVASRPLGHRWIAPDLIGMGQSDKPALGYRFADHVGYLQAFVDALDLSEVVLIGHDWGVALALDLMRRRPELVRAIAFMEGHLRPLSGWEDFDQGGRDLFRRLRAPDVGEQLVLAENFFIDTLLPAGVMRRLTAQELAEYQEPYLDPETRRPLLQWAREIPIGGEPGDVTQLLSAASDHLRLSAVPKLLVHGQPGVLVTPTVIRSCREDLSNLSVVDVGSPAGHFLPEDQPDRVAEALIEWVQQLR